MPNSLNKQNLEGDLIAVNALAGHCLMLNGYSDYKPELLERMPVFWMTDWRCWTRR